MSPGRPAATVHALMRGLVDYAGLFPPAALPMRDAAAAYEQYRESSESWMLGNFVVAIDRLDELAALADARRSRGSPWPLSVVVSGPTSEVGARLRLFAQRYGARFAVSAVEYRTDDATPSAPTATFPDGATLYAELPLTGDTGPLIARIRAERARAKIRTGGTMPGAFPPVEAVAEFITRSAKATLAFKATAGLHHAIGGSYPLTYDADSPRHPMLGFVNLFAAALFAHEGEPVVADILREADGGAFAFGDEQLAWRAHTITLADIVAARESFAISFGSCSFREPVDGLHELGLL